MYSFASVFISITACYLICDVSCVVLKIDDSQYVLAQTKNGQIRGMRENLDAGRSLDTFLGIPYATPPTGQLRFARPRPAGNWTGVRNATEFGSQCAGRPMDKSPQADLPFSEDCLYLNVYAPRSPNSNTSLLPVMLWIHGGGYYGGTGALYNGTELALRGVVVVTINYRLDVFGFLSTADSIIPGNFGMLDQIMAMDWVKDNIANFGGDLNDVTLFGQSAGASSVSLHLISPLSKGKFHKAIMESGTSLCPWAINPSNTSYYAPKPMAEMLGLAVGCSHKLSLELLICLRGVELSYLLNASIGLQWTMRNAMIWVPVIESTFGFLPDNPRNFYSRNAVADVPTIRGYNKNEVAIAIRDPDNVGFSTTKFIELLAETTYFLFQKNNIAVLAEVESVYNQNQTDPYGRRSDFERTLTDYQMVAPITYEAQLHSRLQVYSRSYLYEYSYRSSFDTLPSWMGVVHTDELPFVFGLPQGPAQLYYDNTTTIDHQVANAMVTMWTNFAKTGNPTPPTTDCVGAKKPSCLEAAIGSKAVLGGLYWPSVNEDVGSLLQINQQSEVGPFVRSKAVDLWMEKIPRLEKILVKN